MGFGDAADALVARGIEERSSTGTAGAADSAGGYLNPYGSKGFGRVVFAGTL